MLLQLNHHYVCLMKVQHEAVFISYNTSQCSLSKLLLFMATKDVYI